jgi:trans-aconitate methyltransferase
MIERAKALREGLSQQFKATGRILRVPIYAISQLTMQPRCHFFQCGVAMARGSSCALLAGCFRALRPGGMLAVQMPANDRETAQVTIQALAHEPRWNRGRSARSARRRIGRYNRPKNTSAMLAAIGFVDIDCHYHTFRHPMSSPAEVVEWSRATVLRLYLDQLTAEQGAAFVEELTRRLEVAYDTTGGLTFEFRRLFLFAGRAVSQAAAKPDRH